MTNPTNSSDIKKMYMIRNPWGNSYYYLTWSDFDPAWTSGYISQVPHNVDPRTSQSDGIFFMEHTNLAKCFSNFIIAHYRDKEGYTDDWFDVENDWGEPNYQTLKFTVPEKDGDLYLTVESYF